MTSDERLRLIHQYRDGYKEVRAAMDGMSAADLDKRRAPGAWSTRQIIHHLADSEMTSAIRLRRLLAEDSPEIIGYDQDRFARDLRYDQRAIEPSLEALKAARESTMQILETMTPEEWKRAGRHSEVGEYTPEVWLKIYAAHAHGHAAQIRANRDA